MKKLTAITMAMLPATAMAHVTGAPHMHAEHGAGWLLGVALIAAAAGVLVRQARAERRK